MGCMKSRHIIYFVLSLFTLLLALLILTPTILSTQWVKEKVLVPAFEDIYKGKLSIGDLDLSWFGTQKIQNVTWKSSRSGAEVHFNLMTIKTPLYRMVFYTPLLEKAQIKNLTVKLSDLVSLQNGRASLDINDDVLRVFIDGQTIQNSHKGSIKVQGQFPLGCAQNFYDIFFCRDEAILKAGKLHAEIKNFPSDFLNFPATPLNIPISEFLGSELNGTLDYNQGRVHVVGASSQGNADFSLDFSEKGISFPRDGKLVYKMPQSAAEKLKEAGLPFFDSPLILTMIQGDDLKIHVQLDRATIRDGLALKDVAGSFLVTQDLHSLQLDLNSLLSDRSGQSPFSIKGDVSFKPALQYDLEARGNQLKTTYLEPFFHDPKHRIKGLSLGLLGSNVQAAAKATGSPGKTLIQVELQSGQVNIPGILFQLNDGVLTLAQPANLDFAFSMTAFANYLEGVEAQKLPQTIPMQIHLKNLQIRLEKTIDPEDVVLAADITLKETALKNIPYLGGFSLTKGLVSLSGPSLAKINCLIAGRLNHWDSQYAISRALEPVIRFQWKSQIGFDSNWDLIIHQFKLASDDNQLNFHLNGHQDKEDPYKLLIDGEAAYILLPHRFHEIQNVENPDYQLMAPAHFNLKVDQASINTRHPSFKSLKFQGKLLVDRIDVEEERSQTASSLNQIVIPLTFDAKKQMLTFKVDAQTSNLSQSGSGTVHLDAVISQLFTDDRIDLSQWRVNSELSLTSFPVAIIEALFAMDGLDELLGDTIEGHLSVNDEREGEEGHATFDFKGDGFQLKGALKADEFLTLEDPEKPVVVEWMLTPARFNFIREHLLKQGDELLRQMTLYESTTIAASLSDLSLLLSDPYQGKGALSFACDKLVILDDLTDDHIFLEGVFAHIETENFSRSIKVSFDSKGHIFNKVNEEFHLSAKLVVDNLVDALGTINLANSTIQFQGYSSHAPVIFLSNLFSIDQGVVDQIEALIGHRLDSEINLHLVNLNGPVKMNLAGTLGKLSFDGNYSGGALTLNQPLAAEFQIGPRLTDSMLDEILPLLNSAQGSDNKINIAISPEGFYYPLWSDNPYQFTIGSMRVDFGRIYFQNNHQISEILSILKYTSPDQLIPVWFTPLYFSYNNGIAELRRIDMLVADRFPIAIWGKVNFIEDKVNLKIGLGGLTLKRAFGLKGVPNDYYLQVSLKGTTSDPSIDMGSASTKIAAFISQFRGGPQGLIFGGLMDLLGGQKPTPRPTTTPFPWDVH